MKIQTEIGDYGPVIILAADSRYPFKFGPKKAALILASIPEIAKFAQAHGEPVNPGLLPAPVQTGAPAPVNS
jgi:hypothetical protein